MFCNINLNVRLPKLLRKSEALCVTKSYRHGDFEHQERIWLCS